MRILLDSNILVRAHAAAKGSGRALLEAILAGTHTLLVPPFLLSEVERVLAYPRLQARWPLSPEEIRGFVEALARVAESVGSVGGEIPQVVAKDPDDNPIVQAAVVGKADVPCTLDRHLLAPDVQAYCADRGIRIMGDVELLRILTATSPERPEAR